MLRTVLRFRICYNTSMHEQSWSKHPAGYRKEEVQQLITLLRAGECVSLIGLSGMGKSNLLGFMAYRASLQEKHGPVCILVDCNRLPTFRPDNFFHLASHQLQQLLESLGVQREEPSSNPMDMLNNKIGFALENSPGPLAMLLDGFDDLAKAVDRAFFNQLRSLRDSYKYRLSFLLATRQPLKNITGTDKIREFDDLLVSNQVWLRPLSLEDARWTIRRYEERLNLDFDKDAIHNLLTLSGHHPGLLKALAAAWSYGDPTKPPSWLNQAAVSRECELLWGDLPEESRNAIYDAPIDDEILTKAGLVLQGQLSSPVFAAFIQEKSGTELRFNRTTGEIYRGGALLSASLTAKEFDLLSYLVDNEGAICEKDVLIRAVWPEDKIYEEGIRDDSLAQLVRRLRTKIEPDPSNPTYLQTIAGRGYRFIQPD
jgi:energy-coupling factor transporter ATP-binding protein EcfA2